MSDATFNGCQVPFGSSNEKFVLAIHYVFFLSLYSQEPKHSDPCGPGQPGQHHVLPLPERDEAHQDVAQLPGTAPQALHDDHLQGLPHHHRGATGT